MIQKRRLQGMPTGAQRRACNKWDAENMSAEKYF